MASVSTKRGSLSPSPNLRRNTTADNQIIGKYRGIITFPIVHPKGKSGGEQSAEAWKNMLEEILRTPKGGYSTKETTGLIYRLHKAISNFRVRMKENKVTSTGSLTVTYKDGDITKTGAVTQALVSEMEEKYKYIVGNLGVVIKYQSAKRGRTQISPDELKGQHTPDFIPDGPSLNWIKEELRDLKILLPNRNEEFLVNIIGEDSLFSRGYVMRSTLDRFFTLVSHARGLKRKEVITKDKDGRVISRTFESGRGGAYIVPSDAMKNNLGGETPSVYKLVLDSEGNKSQIRNDTRDNFFTMIGKFIADNNRFKTDDTKKQPPKGGYKEFNPKVFMAFRSKNFMPAMEASSTDKAGIFRDQTALLQTNPELRNRLVWEYYVIAGANELYAQNAAMVMGKKPEESKFNLDSYISRRVPMPNISFPSGNPNPRSASRSSSPRVGASPSLRTSPPRSPTRP